MRELFVDFELDREAFELRRDGAPVPLEPQALEVLGYLVARPGRLVTKEEILDEVWGNRFVSDAALSGRIKEARRALGDDGQAQRLIKTVHGRGYRFLPEVRTVGRASEPPDQGAPPPHNLPSERTPLFGRDQEVDAGAALVAGHRLVSMLGMGGVGKTRLAIAVARRSLADFPDGTWFVDLVPATDERTVSGAIARAGGLSLASGDPTTQLAGLLADRRVLLLLDNCEHVRVDVAAVVDHLLDHTIAPHVLLTSRQALELSDEHRVQVAPLEVSGSGETGETAPAVALFAEAAARAGAVADPRDAAIRRICQRMDGLPLALELAAAQLRYLSAAELGARLDQRFELLEQSPPPGRDRHASLGSVLADTWAMTTEEEASLLRLTAMFAGRFSLADAEEVAGDRPGRTARTLARLVDRSLVARDAEAPESTYRLLETVRLFADQQSTPEQRRAARDRHAGWVLERVGADVHRHVYDFGLASWCLAHEPDLHAADRHLTGEGRAAEAAGLWTATALAMHVDVGTAAAETLFRVETHLEGDLDDALAARLHVTGVFAGMAVRSPAAIRRHGRAGLARAERAGDPVLRVLALVLASWSVASHDLADAVLMVERARDLAVEAADAAGLNAAEGYRAFYLAMLHRPEEAVAQAAAVTARIPEREVADHSAYVGVVALAACVLLDDPPRAAEWTDALLSRPSPDRAMWGSQILVAAVHASNGRAAECAAACERIHERLTRAGRDSLPDLLVPPAVLAYQRGDRARATRWLRAVRDADRPTQSFQVTCVYRRLRDLAGLAETSPLAEATLEEVAEEALAWLGDAGTADRGVPPDPLPEGRSGV